jgi:hypothetical protein
MEYRTQTYIGAVQLLAVIAGSLFLRASVNALEDLLNPDYYPDPLKYLRPLSQYGWTLILIPIAWVVLTIRGERSDLWWATKSLTIGSGIVIILGILVLFGWAGFAAASIATGRA